jgi:hypothetical protein
MKFYSFFLFISFVFNLGLSSYAQTIPVSSTVKNETLTQIRNLFYEAIEDEDKLEELESYFQSKFSPKDFIYHPILLAYTGAIDALVAKHAFSPFTKFSRVLASLNTLERAVERDPHNLEIRFIRFSILHNLPGFFGYSNERDADISEITYQLSKKDYVKYDPKLQKNVIDFMIASERLNEAQILQLKKLAVALASNE